MDIGKKIKQLRHKNNDSQEELAKFIHVSRQTISKQECGINTPTLENIDNICEKYNLSIQQFVGDEELQEVAPDSSTERPSYICLILLTGILAWIYPSLVFIIFLEIIIFKYILHGSRYEMLLIYLFCSFYTITIFIYPDLYYSSIIEGSIIEKLFQ